MDTSTAQVLGVAEFLGWLTPDSAAGRALGESLAVFGADARDAWQHEMECLAQADRWQAENSAVQSTLRQALGALPQLERMARKLDAQRVLEEADLFQVKQFLYFSAQILQIAGDLLGAWHVPAQWGAALDALMHAIHPQKHRTPRFHLAAELDPQLEALRAALRQNRKLERRLRTELERAITADYGGGFDIHGSFRADDESALTADRRLVRVGDAWQLKDPRLSAAVAQTDAVQREVEAAEYTLRARLSRLVRQKIDWLQEVAAVLAALDLRLAKVRLRCEIDGCWPAWRKVPGIVIRAGREPLTAAALAEREADFQPVDLALGERAVVLTGPNMGGKSLLLRLVGLCQWCAQHAMPVPAAACEFAPVAAIIYVGAEEALEAEVEGLSSFGREVRRLVEFWDAGVGQNPRGMRMWLLDEVGRGTHPDEGAEIAREIIEARARRGDRVLAATHFPRVAALESADRLRIAGLTDPQRLQQLLSDPDIDVQDALREAMDYRPVALDAGARGSFEVPRDARLVAQALGLRLADEVGALNEADETRELNETHKRNETHERNETRELNETHERNETRAAHEPDASPTTPEPCKPNPLEQRIS